MSKMNELNKRAAEYGMGIFGSRHRENRYFLAKIVGEFKRVSPDAPIEIIAEWLDDLDEKIFKAADVFKAEGE